MKIKPKKKFGQNFLVDKVVLKKIVDISNISKNDLVFEVGPGTGNLTEFLLEKKPKELKVIEKDKDLIPNLKKKFADNISIINDDILNINEKKIFKSKCKVFGNLPYNISTTLIINWILRFEDDLWFDEMFLMFQKEVANRIICSSKSKNYGRLSILANWRLYCEKIFDIPPSSFFPVPKVDSSLVRIFPKKKYHKITSLKNLEKITKIFFNQRRKKIKKPMMMIFKNFQDIADKLDLDLDSRPQNIKPEDYYKLSNLI